MAAFPLLLYRKFKVLSSAAVYIIPFPYPSDVPPPSINPPRTSNNLSGLVTPIPTLPSKIAPSATVPE